jgi:hypothetical protein
MWFLLHNREKPFESSMEWGTKPGTSTWVEGDEMRMIFDF